ncbi:ribbon-helix-helix domain-containing protein [Sphingomonas sp.]|uniref:ribbon-helix-helix domain-containing protein n=1 Tax=Sphingomonas sp. TaxID=28214 RepID=UPI0035C82712
MSALTAIGAPPGGFCGPVKRSITIAGHQTSISLEPVFWAALEGAAAARSLPISALVAQIDALRIAQSTPPNLASALRSWLFVSGTLPQEPATPLPSERNVRHSDA